MYLFPKGSSRTVRERCNCKHQYGWRARVDAMANTREPLINVVKAEQVKGADRLEPKGNVTGIGVCSFLYRRQATSPADRRSLTYRGTPAEHGKPVPLPTRESNPQGTPTEVQVEDDGKSERRAVMARIEGLLHTKVG